MPTIVGILTFMRWISFMLSWVEYEKSFITSGPSPVYVYRRRLRITMIRLTKISCAGPNYESIRTLSYSFISTLDPTGSEHQQIYSSLRETEQVILSFHARIQRWGRGSGPPGESRTMLRTKNEELLSDSRAWTPLAKIPGFAHGFALGTYNHGSI